MLQPGWGTLQHYFSIPYYIAVKLAMWDSILSITPPEKNLVYPLAILHYARGMAYLGKQDIHNAEKELNFIKIASSDTTLQHLTVWNINTTADLVQIAFKVLSAELAANQNNFNTSISLLKEAIALEDNLNYNEPPDWIFSVRHHLGAILLKAGKYNEAEHVYRKDLQKWKLNGWALNGLYHSLLLQKKIIEARKVKADFDESWQFADVKLNSPVNIVSVIN
jgi:tetratricopeptide (TPR) repeat protein